jgi:pimeloyl-ACP methyl ester carboxylesterase
MSQHTVTGGDGTRLAVHEYGPPEGKAILLVHGISHCHLAWSKQYRSELADGFRLVCPDLRGHGMSDKPASLEYYTEDRRWADDVHGVIAARALHKPLLVGWSYGGYVINDYLALYGSEALRGVNYVCAGVLLGVQKAAGTLGREFIETVPGLCSEDLRENIRAVRTLLRLIFEKQPSQEEFEELLASNMVVPPLVRAGMVSRAIDRDVVMQGLNIPVLVTRGEKDRVVLASHTNHLLSCIPHAQASIYEDTGHSPHWEDPMRFNRELACFATQYAG